MRVSPSRGDEMGRDDATTSDEWDDRGWSSHGGHPVDLDVPHRTVAVSANHFLSIDDRRFRGDALQPVLRYRPIRPLPTDPPNHENDDGENRDDGEEAKTQVKGRQLQEDRTVSQSLIVSWWTMRDSVAPQRSVYARIQLWTSLFAIAWYLQSCCRCYRWSVKIFREIN